MVAESLSGSVVSMCADWYEAVPGMESQQVDTTRINKRVSIPKRIIMKSKEVNNQ